MPAKHTMTILVAFSIGCATPTDTLDVGEGLLGDATSVAVDFEAVQARVTGDCEDGAITSIGGDGSVECAPAAAAADHDHDADYAAVDHDHDADYIGREDYTGHNNTSCDDDKGFLVVGNFQEEFGCSVTCTAMCARHDMTCDRAYTVGGTYRTCTSVNNNESLYCWCRG